MTPLFVLFSLLPLVPAQADRFGTPRCSGPDQELADRAWFLLCYSGSTRTPLWVGYQLERHQLAAIAARPNHFRRDPDLTLPSATDDDYRNSGLNRGHMAPARDFAWSASALRATFLLSNAVPQYAGPNSGIWSRLEASLRRIAAQSDAVVIFTGPIFDSPEPPTIGAGRVAVPSHTYKVALALQGDTLTMYAAIVPNAPVVTEPLDSFVTTVDEVERRTTLDFFYLLEDVLESDLESQIQPLPARR